MTTLKEKDKQSTQKRIEDVLGCRGTLKRSDVSDRIFFYPEFSDLRFTVEIKTWSDRS